MAEKLLLKDLLFHEKNVTELAARIKQVYSPFDEASFISAVVKKFPELELTPRILWITQNLKLYLPNDYKKATQILLDSLPPHTDTNNLDTDFGDFIYAPYSDFVATYGCSKEFLSFSLSALKEMTTRFSAEGSIRSFINMFPKETHERLMLWSTDKDYHLRRLVSEGTRPKLPWAKKITTPPNYALSLLDNLFFDPSRFVTRSVANHLNDISKIDPALVLETLSKWQKSGKQHEKEMEYIINQSLRTLVKQGNNDAITFLQFSTDPKIKLSNFVITNDQVCIGDRVEFTFTLTAQKGERLLIDYVIYFHNKAGNGHNRKVFKLKIITMKRDQTIVIEKRHRMMHFSTRKLYPGKHKIEIQINGIKMGEKIFTLV